MQFMDSKDFSNTNEVSIYCLANTNGVLLLSR